jgi:hypothetical protein
VTLRVARERREAEPANEVEDAQAERGAIVDRERRGAVALEVEHRDFRRISGSVARCTHARRQRGGEKNKARRKTSMHEHLRQRQRTSRPKTLNNFSESAPGGVIQN